MAKFYVQTGNVRTVVHAEDAQGAALWMVHQTLQGVLPTLDDEGQPATIKPRRRGEESLVLSGRLQLSERGFDRDDAETFDVYPLVSQWAQLMTALSKLDDMVHRSGAADDSLGSSCATAL